MEVSILAPALIRASQDIYDEVLLYNGGEIGLDIALELFIDLDAPDSHAKTCHGSYQCAILTVKA